jgi:hypothetical protein
MTIDPKTQVVRFFGARTYHKFFFDRTIGQWSIISCRERIEMNAAQQKELAEQKRGIRATGDRLQGLIRDHANSLTRFPALDSQRERLITLNHTLASILTQIYDADVEKKAESKPATLTEFIRQKGYKNWYVSNVPVRTPDAAGKTRIKQSVYDALRAEFEALWQEVK